MSECRNKDLPEVSHRQSFATSGSISAMMDELMGASEHSPDPTQLHWREWRRLHNEAVVRCHHAQDLEAQLLRTVGAPMVRIRRAPDAEDLTAHSRDEIDQILKETDTPDAVAEDLHKKLTTRKREWDKESDRIGFAAAAQQEDQAWARERQAAGMIFQAPAKSLTGVQMKLALMIQMAVEGTGDSIPPISQLQSIFSDLARLNKADAVS